MRRPRGPVYLLGRAATPGAAETRRFLSRYHAHVLTSVGAKPDLRLRAIAATPDTASTQSAN